MSQLITWTLGCGSAFFALGLVSAIGSRRQRKNKPLRRVVLDRSSLEAIEERFEAKRNTKPTTAMSMAAEGTGNVSGSAVSALSVRAEGNLASVVSHTS